MYDLAVKNGTIVDEVGLLEGNLYIKDGKIAAVTDTGSSFEAKETVDAKGKLIFPGAVDCHMHIGEYNAEFEDMQTSTMSAAAGGVTTCIDMPLNLYTPSVLNASAVNLKISQLSQESYVDFCVWGGLTPQSLDNLEEMHEAGAISFKSFLSGGGNDFYAPTIGQVRKALMKIKSFGGLAGFHCEDYSIIQYEKERVLKNQIDGRQAFLDSRPLSAEIIAAKDIIELARETGAKVHICHVSHPDVAAAIEGAQRDGVNITAETCPHFLTFTDKDYLKNGCAFGCAPPLRSEQARDELWNYVKKGVIGCIASDHSPGMPENRSDKNQPTYMSGYGISGVETMFQTVYDQGVNRRGLSPAVLARSLSAFPAKRWGLYGKKGAVKVGFDADFLIFDSNKEWVVDPQKLHYKQKITAFSGLTGRGVPIATYLRGVKIAQYGEIKVNKGFGEFVIKPEAGEKS